jgi:hypothetical protein
MKQVLVALFLITVYACTTAYAESRLMAGVRVGPNLADVSGSLANGAPYKPKPGLIAGAAAEWRSEEPGRRLNSGLRVEVSYVQKGWIGQVHRVDENANYVGWFEVGTAHIDELVFSPLYVLRYQSPRLTPYVLIGPEMGINLSAYENMSSDLGGGVWRNPWGWKKNPNFGLNAGVGGAFPMGGGEGSVEMRYNLGLTNLSGATYVRSIKTNGIQLVLGYSFDLRKIR